MSRVHRKLRDEFTDVDFFLDDAAHSIHKLTVPGEQEPQEDLYIVEKGGKLKLLSEDSAIIGKIPKRVRTVRIFADAKEETLLEQIRNRARELEAQAA